METYKGFNKDMTAKNGFQYKEGKEYEEEKAVACECGFRACEYPLDCFGYYSPANSVYHIVEQSGELSKNSSDTKVASTKIKIGAEISIAGLVKAAIEYTKEKAKPESDATGYYGASSATGYCGSAIAGNPESVAVAWGYKSKAKGIVGAYIVLADWEENGRGCSGQKEWSLKSAKMVRIDGEKIKADTCYTMENGEIVEVEE